MKTKIQNILKRMIFKIIYPKFFISLLLKQGIKDLHSLFSDKFNLLFNENMIVAQVLEYWRHKTCLLMDKILIFFS